MLTKLVASVSFFIVTVLSVSVWAIQERECPCTLHRRPEKRDKAMTARWMVHSLDWGTLTTVSSRLGDHDVPFGNIYSFVDGTCSNSTGIPYFYGTYLDQSLIDSMANPMVSLSLSEASLASVCGNKDRIEECSLGSRWGDPENPVCARLTLTGELVVLPKTSAEYDFASQSLFQRHATMAKWPRDHNWLIFKIDIQDVWLIDYFGGAAIISPEEYFGVDLLTTVK